MLAAGPGGKEIFVLSPDSARPPACVSNEHESPSRARAWRRESMPCCRKPSAPAAAMPDAGPMPPRSRPARRRSINARPAAAPRFARSPRCWAGRSAPESGERHRVAARASRGSTRPAASAAPDACRPAPSMRSWARRNSCTRCSPIAARAASCASRPARWTASKCGRAPRSGAIEPRAQSRALHRA